MKIRRNVFAFTKKGFTMLEFLISLILVTLTAIALFNGMVLLLHQKVKKTIQTHTADAAINLVAYPDKLNNCLESLGHNDPCVELKNNCDSSIYCSDSNICEDVNKCVVCYTNPESGKKIYYGFVSDNLTNGTYKVTLCWNYAGQEGNYTTVISIPEY